MAASGMLLGDLASRGARLFGDRPAVCWGDRVRTHRELSEFVPEIARSPTSKVVKRELRAAHDPDRCVRPSGIR